MARTVCSCHSLPYETPCPEYGETLSLMHIPGYFGTLGLPTYSHVVISGVIDLNDIAGSFRVTLDKQVEQDAKCKYKSYPIGEPEKRLKCDSCYKWRGNKETDKAFKAKHKGHSLRIYWLSDSNKEKLESS